jgi:hypothetical protein
MYIAAIASSVEIFNDMPISAVDRNNAQLMFGTLMSYSNTNKPSTSLSVLPNIPSAYTTLNKSMESFLSARRSLLSVIGNDAVPNKKSIVKKKSQANKDAMMMQLMSEMKFLDTEEDAVESTPRRINEINATTSSLAATTTTSHVNSDPMVTGLIKRSDIEMKYPYRVSTQSVNVSAGVPSSCLSSIPDITQIALKRRAANSNFYQVCIVEV